LRMESSVHDLAVGGLDLHHPASRHRIPGSRTGAPTTTNLLKRWPSEGRRSPR
jgi:hypothetical protein